MIRFIQFFLCSAIIFLSCGCQMTRLTSAPGAPEVSAEDYAQKYWKKIARPTPVFTMKRKGLSEEETAAYFQNYINMFQKFAPYLPGEYEAYDKGLGWPRGTYLKRTFYPLDQKAMLAGGHECTSWAVLPDLAAENQVLLHKNRDTNLRKSVVVHRNVPGKYGYIGLSDIGWMDVTMGMNSVGVAISMNSGDPSSFSRFYGMDTTLMARIILENCKTADEALTMLIAMLKEGVYAHANTGSIWLIADRNCAFVIENDAGHSGVEKYESGGVLRANTWSLPSMLRYSRKSAAGVLHSRSREFAVIRELFDHGRSYNRPVTVEQMAKAARVSRIPENPKAAVPCASRTVSAATFSIDREFPADLSLMFAAVGNPDYTLFIPIPLTVDQLPDVLLNQDFSAAVYKAHAAKRKILTDQERSALEQKLNQNIRSAREEAREILRADFSTEARLKARRIMNQAFAENWKIIGQKLKIK
ncbi:MAG: hypothetical protein IJW23_10345 [Lentisphaeria bacterium]|nr:hypothetical protein [Lentisphaeria bacterium]